LEDTSSKGNIVKYTAFWKLLHTAQKAYLNNKLQHINSYCFVETGKKIN